MVAGGWMKINNFHSCIILLWNIASMCTMQFIHSIRGQEIFPLFSQTAVEKQRLSESQEPFCSAEYLLHWQHGLL